MLNKLVIISNESIYKKEESFCCDNIDLKSIPEGLNKYFEVINIGRKSKYERFHEINLKKNNNIVASNIFIILFNIYKTFRNKEITYLLISITPYTFFSYLLLFLSRKKIFVYIRSSGYEEYKHLIGFLGPLLYHIMFAVVTWKANLISCNSDLLKNKSGKTVKPSQLNEKWFQSHQKADLNSIKLLYIGRVKVEKGIFSLLKIIEDLESSVHLTIVGLGKNSNYNFKQKNVTVTSIENNHQSLIKVYDDHNIFILPSFTESYSQVIDECLSRRRPVIIFKEISNILFKNRKGIFVSERNSISLSKTIKYIIDNYSKIEEDIMKSTLPRKEDFLKEMSNIVRGNL